MTTLSTKPIALVAFAVLILVMSVDASRDTALKFKSQRKSSLERQLVMKLLRKNLVPAKYKPLIQSIFKNDVSLYIHTLAVRITVSAKLCGTS